MSNHEVTLVDEIRVFEQQDTISRQLVRTDTYLQAGETIIISEPDSYIYDDRTQSAVSFTNEGQTYYLLSDELAVVVK